MLHHVPLCLAESVCVLPWQAVWFHPLSSCHCVCVCVCVQGGEAEATAEGGEPKAEGGEEPKAEGMVLRW